jgi:hypothetical protein
VLALHPGRLTSGKRVTDTLWIRGWVGTRSSLEVWRREISHGAAGDRTKATRLTSPSLIHRLFTSMINTTPVLILQMLRIRWSLYPPIIWGMRFSKDVAEDSSLLLCYAVSTGNIISRENSWQTKDFLTVQDYLTVHRMFDSPKTAWQSKGCLPLKRMFDSLKTAWQSKECLTVQRMLDIKKNVWQSKECLTLKECLTVQRLLDSPKTAWQSKECLTLKRMSDSPKTSGQSTNVHLNIAP